MKKRSISLLGLLCLSGIIFWGMNILVKQTSNSPKTTINHTVSKKSSSKIKSKMTKPNEKNVANKAKATKVVWQKQDKPVVVPILMYHSIRSQANNSLCVPPEIFSQQMQWLKENGYYTLNANEAYRVLTTNEVPSQKIVWLTLDDGYEDNYTQAYPILQKYQLKATINLITSAINTPAMLNFEQIKKMQASGLVDYGSHTVHHYELNKLTESQQLQELADSKQWLEEKLGQKIIYLCYPVGRFNEQSLSLAKQTGYLLATTTQPGVAQAQNFASLYQLKRVRITPSLSLQQYSQLIEQTN